MINSSFRSFLALGRRAAACAAQALFGLLLLAGFAGIAHAANVSVLLLAPTPAGPYREPGTFTLTAFPSDTGGTIAHVDYMYDGRFGSGSTANADGSYSVFWNNIPAGSHVIYAVAYDVDGTIANSNAISVQVNRNVPPTVSLTSPADEVTYYAPGTFTVRAVANDSDGSVANVVFYYDGRFGSASNLQPDGSYTYFWNNIPLGTHTIYARATDDSGAGTDSAPHVITVIPNYVSLAAPANNSTYVVPGTFTLRALTGDSAAIASVGFVYDGSGGGPGTRNADGSFSAFWNNIPAGTHTIYARAVDNVGLTLASSPVTILVYPSQPPTVSLAAPATGQVFAPGANIVLQANAADSDGSVTQVQFFNGGTLIGTGTLSSGTAASGVFASSAWTHVPAGTYSITAVATDNTGIAIASAPLSVVVDPNATPSISPVLPSGATTAPANLSLSTTATNTVFGIKEVEFFSNGSPIGVGTLSSGSASSGSYVTNAWTNVAVGSYVVTAVATDENGGVVTSSPVTVVVNTGTGGSSSLYFINADHLNTPRVVEDQNQQTVWRWDQGEPFGDSVPNQTPGSAGAFVFNLRFPGQYYDQETNTNYNIHRDYDASGGRYVQSDPIGLGGGPNTYTYVNGNSLSFQDPSGLVKIWNSNGIVVEAYYKGPEGNDEHAREGPGEAYHVHIYDGKTEVKMSTETWTPLTKEEQKIYDSKAGRKIRNYCESLSEGQKRLIYRINRAIFHTGRMKMSQSLSLPQLDPKYGGEEGGIGEGAGPEGGLPRVRGGGSE